MPAGIKTMGMDKGYCREENDQKLHPKERILEDLVLICASTSNSRVLYRYLGAGNKPHLEILVK